MSRIGMGKNAWALFLLLLAGIVLGGFIGNLVSGISGLGWLTPVSEGSTPMGRGVCT